MPAPIAFYTLVITGFFNLLSALPCLVKPWDMGVKMYMPYKLPTDPRTIGQLSHMQGFMAVAVLSFSSMFIVGSFTCLSSGFVILHMIMLAVGGMAITKELTSDLAGLDMKMCGMQLGVVIITIVILAYSLMTETFEEVEAIEPYPDVTGVLKFTGVFFVLANFAGIVVPNKLIEPYMPDPNMRPTDKYGTAQLGVFIRLLSWVNTSTGALMFYIASAGCDIYPFVLLQIGFSPLFAGFFIAFMKSGLGFDDKPMIFWLIYVCTLAGYLSLAVQLHGFKA